MKKLLQLYIILTLLHPQTTLASAPKPTTVTGTIITLNTGHIIFKSTAAITYTVEIGQAIIIKKQGAPMQLSEIKIGDKIEVSGLTADSNTIYQTNSIRDLSVYPKKGTFTGTITTLNPQQNQFTIYNKTSGNQTIHITPLTTFTQTTQAASSNDLKPGMTATVKGLWERTATDITATQISAKFRYINIELIGTILWKSETGFTIATTTGTLYGINFTAAKLQNKNNQPIQPNEFNVGDTIKIQGKHLAETPQITATTIKNTSK